MSKKQGHSPLSPKGSKRSRPPKGGTGETSLTISKEKVKKVLSEKELPCPHLRRNTSIIRCTDGLYNMVECLDCGEILEPKSEKNKQSSNQAPQINPKDYLRTLTEGCVKPTEDFIWTHDRNEKQIEPPIRPVPKQLWETTLSDNQKEKKKVYCKDCKYYKTSDFIECNHIEKIIVKDEYYGQIFTTEYTLAHIANKENNCKYYSEKWYIKLWRMFK